MEINRKRDDQQKKREYVLYLLAILIITFFSFSSSLNNEFINWDDGKHLSDNPNVRFLDLRHIKEIFSSTVMGTYIPLTIFSVCSNINLLSAFRYGSHSAPLINNVSIILSFGGFSLI